MAREYAGRVSSLSESDDPEEAIFYDTAVPSRWAAVSPARVALGVVGALCVAAACCFLLLRDGSKQRTTLRTNDVVSGRQLLESPGMVNVATSNAMKVCSNLRAEDESFVRETVSQGLVNLSQSMAVRLSDTKIPAERVPHVFQVVGSMADPRVQKIGHEVAQAVHEGRMEGRVGVQRRLKERFEHRLPELRALKREIYKTVGDKEQSTLNLEGMGILQAVPIGPVAVGHRQLQSAGSELTSSDMTDMAAKFEKGLGILAGLVEQTRVCLDQIDFVGESFGRDMKIPYWAKSLVGGLDFVSELSDCVMRANSNQVKLMMCPMKYASAFSDFISCVDNIFGADNGHLSLFGGGSAAAATTTASRGWASFGTTNAPSAHWGSSATTKASLWASSALTGTAAVTTTLGWR